MNYFTTKNYQKWEKKAIKRKLKERLQTLKTDKAKENARNKATILLNDIELKKQKLLSMELPKTIEISVEWKRSRTWGMNPTAEVRVYNGNEYDFTTGHASGCGYDKLSAAIATAFNQSDILKAMILKKVRKLNSYISKSPYHNISALYDDFTFQGGVGVSSYRKLFELLGYKFTHSETKTSDFIYITK